MPTQFSSPGGVSFPIDTSPIPQWDTPTSPYSTRSMTRSSRQVASPHRPAPAPPAPHMVHPPSAAMYGIDSLTISSSPIMRSTSSSSSSSSAASSSSSTSQRVSTPPPTFRTRPAPASKTNSKPLPALPLSIDTSSQTSPCPSPSSAKHQRLPVNYATEGLRLGLPDEVQIVSVSMGSNASPSPVSNIGCLPTPPVTGFQTYSTSPSRSPNRQAMSLPSVGGSTPPRPARRASSVYPSPASATAGPSTGSSLLSPRPISLAPAPHSDLLPPQPSYASGRSISPGGESISTITVSPASTPRPTFVEVAAPKSMAVPESNSALALALQDFAAPMGRKRDSAQRRLSALRGLVADLDFNQPWSITESNGDERPFSPEPAMDPECNFIWTCGGDDYTELEAEASAEDSFIMSSSSEEALAGPVASSISLPLPYVREVRPKAMLNADIADSYGWPESKPSLGIHQDPEPLSTNLMDGPILRTDITPIRRLAGSRKHPSLTPPRRPRQLRSSSELLSRTSEPPRPAARPRREVFDVASSGYSKCLEPVSPLLPVPPSSTWRSSLTSDETHTRLMQTGGPMEVKRQEIIWELCETEHAFIKSMRTVLRLFAIPLKTPQGKWIDGIPGKITDLFDSLERIIHAHDIVSASELDMRRRSEVFDVSEFVAMFKAWVHRLQVHEWYLLKFESVVALVEENIRDPGSVFGEFVRMQMKEKVLGSMSLGSMLLKPVQRLTKYPLFLKRLLDVTPHPHPAHPEILSLLSTTESIILTQQAAKAREEDFEQLQSLESRIVGLPDGFSLAVRDRKLLGQGQIVRVPPGKESPAVGSRSRSRARPRAGSLQSSRESITSIFSASAPSTESSVPVSPWDLSSSSTPSRTSAFSVSSNGSSFYSGPSRSNSVTRPSPFSPSPSRPSVTRSPSSTSSSSFVDRSRPSTPSPMKGRKKEDVLTMLVFDDLVIMGTQAQERRGLFGVGAGKKKGASVLRVLPEAEGGIGKVAEVKDWSGWNGHNALFSLTIEPVSHSAQHPLTPITAAFTIPAPSAPSSSSSLRSIKPSGTSGSGTGLNLSCPALTTLGAFLGMLGQVSMSAAGQGARGSEYVEEKEVLEGHDEGEAEGNEDGRCES